MRSGFNAKTPASIPDIRNEIAVQKHTTKTIKISSLLIGVWLPPPAIPSLVSRPLTLPSILPRERSPTLRASERIPFPLSSNHPSCPRHSPRQDADIHAQNRQLALFRLPSIALRPISP